MSFTDEIYNEAFNDELEKIAKEQSRFGMVAKETLLMGGAGAGLGAGLEAGGKLLVRKNKAVRRLALEGAGSKKALEKAMKSKSVLKAAKRTGKVGAIIGLGAAALKPRS